jgi:dihydrofolate synthase/folylpolyglutamate synthase
VRRVADRLGLLEFHPPTLTVAGTNGKGSSATLASLIYRHAGFRVGLYTSPHLLRYNERVAIDGALASDGDFCRAFAAIESVREEESLTYFEFGTLAALWLFREAKVDAQVLEVGLGGRLDAVNLIDADCALITNIGLDHTDWLGPDRQSIGREKAGILRNGRPAICVEPSPPVSVIDAAKKVCATMQILDRDFHFKRDGVKWEWSGADGAMKALPLPGLAGIAQLRNAAGVLASVQALQPKLPVPESAIRAALPELRLPGRFERHGQVTLDVAHNVEAAQVLVENLQADSIEGRIHLVLGMLRDKPVESFCRVLQPLVSSASLAALPPPRGLSAEELSERARVGGIEGDRFPSVDAALAHARSLARPADRVLVTGSFLTVAAACA